MSTPLANADYSIGGPEAWETQERRSLSQNFLPTEAFAAISKPDKIFLCGRRGTGKSAIAQMLEHTSSHPYAEAFQGENSEYGAYMDIVRELRLMVPAGDIDLRQAIRRLWLWALPVKAMQTIVAKATADQEPADEQLTVMMAYLDSLTPPMHRGSRIGDLLSGTFDAALQAQRTNGASFMRHLMTLTSTPAYQAAVRALANRTASRPVLLVFDTLESYRVFESAMVEGLQGVLQAIVAFGADRSMEHIHLKFFVPAEIYRDVFAPLPGKVGSHAVSVRWRFHDLVGMLARRYLGILERTGTLSHVQRQPMQKSVEEAYRLHDMKPLRSTFWYRSRFLPEKITNRLGEKEDTFEYMLRHTLRRPRDLITQMQSIIDAARVRQEFPFVSEAAVVEGVHRQDVLEQVVADALVPYEGALPRGLYGASSIFFARRRIMTKKALKAFSQELYATYPLVNIGPTDFLNALFHCGLIGVIENPAAPLGRERVCRALFSYLTQTELPLADRFKYCVHPALGDLFRMSTGDEDGVVYPIAEPGGEDGEDA